MSEDRNRDWLTFRFAARHDATPSSLAHRDNANVALANMERAWRLRAEAIVDVMRELAEALRANAVSWSKCPCDGSCNDGPCSSPNAGMTQGADVDALLAKYDRMTGGTDE